MKQSLTGLHLQHMARRAGGARAGSHSAQRSGVTGSLGM